MSVKVLAPTKEISSRVTYKRLRRSQRSTKDVKARRREGCYYIYSSLVLLLMLVGTSGLR